MSWIYFLVLLIRPIFECTRASLTEWPWLSRQTRLSIKSAILLKLDDFANASGTILAFILVWIRNRYQVRLSNRNTYFTDYSTQNHVRISRLKMIIFQLRCFTSNGVKQSWLTRNTKIHIWERPWLTSKMTLRQGHLRGLLEFFTLSPW